MDESGSPGAAQSENDYFLVAAVFVENLDTVYEIQNKVDAFRKSAGLKDDFEFHFYQNSDNQKRAFLGFLSGIDFGYKTFCFKKSRELNYEVIASVIAESLKKVGENMNIIMDSNPHLYKELSRHMRGCKMRVKIKERRSSSSDLIQIADYVAGVTHKELTSNRKDKYGEYLKLKKLP